MPVLGRRPTSCWRANSSAAGAPLPNRFSMSQSPKPRGLGRGLSALLGDDDVAATVTPASPETPRSALVARTPFTLPVAHLRAGPFQPRTTFEDIDSLVDSI